MSHYQVASLLDKIKRIEDMAPCQHRFKPGDLCQHPKAGHDRHFEHEYVQPRWLSHALLKEPT